MGVQMLFLIRDLVKGRFASEDRTSVGSLTCMNSKVIKEVVPFRQYSVASIEVALEVTLSPARTLFNELYNSECL